jgi:acetolactate decarboxylase
VSQLVVDVPASLEAALEKEKARSGRSMSSLITTALAQFLEKPLHTVFQVSTSGALVAGVYDREVRVQAILQHGNFGLGTFANLDGEMVVVDGHVYQVKGSGEVLEASADAGAPFAVVTWFEPETDAIISPMASLKDLEAGCDAFRRSGNIFYAIRLDGVFRRVRTRTRNPPDRRRQSAG